MANILANANGDFNVGATWIGGVAPGPGDNAYLNTRTIAIDGDITCDKISNRNENGASAGGTLTLAVDGVTITADLDCHDPTLLTVTADVDLDVVGDINGGSTAGDRAIVWNSPGVLTVTGTLTVGIAATTYAVYGTHSSGVVNIIGNVTGSGVTAVPPVAVSGAGSTLNIVGDVTGGSLAGADGSQVTSNAIGHVTGNVTGGSGAASMGVETSSGGGVTVVGNCYGGVGVSAYGLNCSSNGVSTVIGDAIADEAGTQGVHNASIGTVHLKRAVANSWGPGGTATAVGYGVVNANVAGVVIVEEVEYGPNGMPPTLGVTFFKSTGTTNKCIVTLDSAAGQQTLVNAADVAGLVPDEEDVREGVVYAGAVNTGTLAVPIPAAVAAGVPTDDTVGTAVITIPILASVLGQIIADAMDGG